MVVVLAGSCRHGLAGAAQLLAVRWVTPARGRGRSSLWRGGRVLSLVMVGAPVRGLPPRLGGCGAATGGGVGLAACLVRRYIWRRCWRCLSALSCCYPWGARCLSLVVVVALWAGRGLSLPRRGGALGSGEGAISPLGWWCCCPRGGRSLSFSAVVELAGGWWCWLGGGGPGLVCAAARVAAASALSVSRRSRVATSGVRAVCPSWWSWCCGRDGDCLFLAVVVNWAVGRAQFLPRGGGAAVRGAGVFSPIRPLWCRLQGCGPKLVGAAVRVASTLALSLPRRSSAAAGGVGAVCPSWWWWRCRRGVDFRSFVVVVYRVVGRALSIPRSGGPAACGVGAVMSLWQWWCFPRGVWVDWCSCTPCRGMGRGFAGSTMSLARGSAP